MLRHLGGGAATTRPIRADELIRESVRRSSPTGSSRTGAGQGYFRPTTLDGTWLRRRSREGILYPWAARIDGIRVYHEADVERGRTFWGTIVLTREAGGALQVGAPRRAPSMPSSFATSIAQRMRRKRPMLQERRPPNSFA